MAKTEEVFKIIVSLEWLEDLTFKLNFENPSLPELLIDETHDNNSLEAIGPNPARLLLSAILGCLNASFAFCLKKSRVPLKTMKAKGELTIQRNEEGFLRVSQMNIELTPEIEIEKGVPRLEKCIEIFHNYCTITESVRQGIPVNVTINKDKIKNT
ncbi:MAG TPA: OsmC family protein [Candidatus Deferrimicrobium sp.]|nr:OsmC family protein [Candidatus Deferrimicrobium sp.]